MTRNTTVLDHSLFSTVVATVLTAAAPLAATFVDGLISGNLIGQTAFNAINIILPISNLMMVLNLICNMGGSVLAAKALGTGDRTLARKIFSISFLSALTVSITSTALIFFNLDPLCAYLCPDPEGFPLVRQYLKILALYFLLYPFTTTLNNFISVEGYPGLTTRIVVISNAVNILLDLVFIIVLDWGIRGAAWATVVSGVVNVLLYIPHFLRGKSQYSLEKLDRKDLHLCKGIFSQGFGFNIFYITTNLLMMFSNALVLGNFGSDGMTMYGVCLQIQSFTFCVAVGLSIAGISQITALLVDDDFEAIRHIMKRLILNSACFYSMIMLVMSIFPEATAALFGIHDPDILEECRLPFFCFSFYYLCFGILAVYSTICFQMMGHVWAKAVFVLGLGFTVYVLMLALSLVSPGLMWLGFPIGGMLVLAGALFFAYSRYLKDRTLTKFTLVSRFPNDVRVNLSIRKDGQDIPQMLDSLRSFSDICEISEQNKYNVELCCLELCDSIKESGHQPLKGYFDLTFKYRDDKFLMTVKAPGAPYCLKLSEETLQDYHKCPESLSLEETRKLILNLIPEEITYRYMFGLNVTTLAWSKD